jgi:hypothetical protein
MNKTEPYAMLFIPGYPDLIIYLRHNDAIFMTPYIAFRILGTGRNRRISIGC